MENITFYEQINLFLENKRPRKPLVCVRRVELAYTSLMHVHIVRVLETYERQIFCINVEVWNEFHIVWEPFQTLIFSLYKAIHGTFSKHTKNPKGNPKIH